jgi:hypothetical protein
MKNRAFAGQVFSGMIGVTIFGILLTPVYALFWLGRGGRVTIAPYTATPAPLHFSALGWTRSALP